jgi:hypothetical protein
VKNHRRRFFPVPLFSMKFRASLTDRALRELEQSERE